MKFFTSTYASYYVLAKIFHIEQLKHICKKNMLEYTTIGL